MMDAPDLELLARSVQHALSSHDGAALDEALVKLGWQDALAIDRPTAVRVLFEEQGRANRASSALDQVVVSGLGQDPLGVGAIFPALGSWAPPARVAAGQVEVSGLAGVGLAHRESALVVIEGAGPATVPVGSLDIHPVAGLDPELGLVKVTGRLAPPTTEPLGDAWPGAVRDAQLALGHELVGASRRLLELATEHALSRVQFGRPIGTFQAVRHRLADTLVAIETADAALDAAWIDRTAVAAAIAKALAGRAGATAARHGQQVLAGIGFTTEHPLHRSIRRVLVLDRLFGSSTALTRALGEQLHQVKRLPPLTPL
jgi:hypothetical protein